MASSKGGSEEGAGGLCVHVARLGRWSSTGVQLGSGSLSSPLLLGFSPRLQLFEKE